MIAWDPVYMHETAHTISRPLPHRIGGDNKGAVLQRTSMGEKETMIDGLPPFLMTADEVNHAQEEEEKKEYGHMHPRLIQNH